MALRQEPYAQSNRKMDPAPAQHSRERNLLTQAIALDHASLDTTFYSDGET